MQKEKWKWDWKFCEKGGGKKENAERKVEVRLKIQWERWKWKRKCGEKSESKNSKRKVKPRGNLESHGWVETERGHSSVQRWVVDTFKIAADPTFFCLVSNKNTDILHFHFTHFKYISWGEAMALESRDWWYKANAMWLQPILSPLPFSWVLKHQFHVWKRYFYLPKRSKEDGNFRQ